MRLIAIQVTNSHLATSKVNLPACHLTSPPTSSPAPSIPAQCLPCNACLAVPQTQQRGPSPRVSCLFPLWECSSPQSGQPPSSLCSSATLSERPSLSILLLHSASLSPHNSLSSFPTCFNSIALINLYCSIYLLICVYLLPCNRNVSFMRVAIF